MKQKSTFASIEHIKKCKAEIRKFKRGNDVILKNPEIHLENYKIQRIKRCVNCCHSDTDYMDGSICCTLNPIWCEVGINSICDDFKWPMP